MKQLIVLMVILIVGSITFEEGSVWHPEGSNSYYTFGNNITLNWVNLTDTSFLSTLNLTIHSNANITLYSMSANYMNYSTTTNLNISACGVSNNTFKIWSDGTYVYTDVVPVDTCITYSLSAAGYANQSSGVTGCEVVQYSRYNGTYTYSSNQSIDFYCFPKQTACYPYKQTSMQYVANWTNTYAEAKKLNMRVNETVRGWTLYANEGSDNNVTAVNITTAETTPIYVADVAMGDMASIWLYMNTFYPFDNWDGTLIMEACDA